MRPFDLVQAHYYRHLVFRGSRVQMHAFRNVPKGWVKAVDVVSRIAAVTQQIVPLILVLPAPTAALLSKRPGWFIAPDRRFAVFLGRTVLCRLL